MGAAIDRHLAALVEWDSVDDHFAEVAAFVAEVGADDAQSAALRWLVSGDREAEGVGLDVLGVLAERDERSWLMAQNGVLAERAERSWLKALEQAERFSESESADVRVAAAVALGWRVDRRALELWLRFARDDDAAVRQRAMAVLPFQFDRVAPDERIVSALLAGLEDADPDVRDWAALALGSQVGMDTPELRDALARHLDDEGANTAGEAAVGLAGRGDEGVFPVLCDWLAREDVGDLWVEAAGELGDPRLQPLLEQLRERGWEDDEGIARPEVLGEAIERCRSGSVRD